jgi:hypothetical protein
VDRVFCVYILTNQRNTVLYTGVTGDLAARVYQHREKLLPGFTNRYNVFKLVYYEAGYDASGAIAPRNDSSISCHCEECSDDAISIGRAPSGPRLLRCARYDSSPRFVRGESAAPAGGKLAMTPA